MEACWNFRIEYFVDGEEDCIPNALTPHGLLGWERKIRMKLWPVNGVICNFFLKNSTSLPSDPSFKASWTRMRLCRTIWMTFGCSTMMSSGPTVKFSSQSCCAVYIATWNGSEVYWGIQNELLREGMEREVEFRQNHMFHRGIFLNP